MIIIIYTDYFLLTFNAVIISIKNDCTEILIILSVKYLNFGLNIGTTFTDVGVFLLVREGELKHYKYQPMNSYCIYINILC